MNHLNIDLETFSSVPINKASLYKYVQSPDFEILLFGYSVNGSPSEIVDFAQGEILPDWVYAALTDPAYIKHAHNAPFEWYCLSKFCGRMLPVDQWRDTMLHALYCGLPASLDAVGKALGLPAEKQMNGQHALVFYNFQHDRDRLIEALTATGLRVRVYSQERDEQDWNNGEIDILLAHPASCGYGLNLQLGGHHVVWFWLTWSLEQYEQANKRLHRQGQEHPVFVHHLIVQGGTDEDVIEALHYKGDMQNALMEALKARINKLHR